MADDKTQPIVSVPPEPTMLNPVEMQQGQAGTAPQTAPRPAPPRQPLFRK